MTKHKMKTRIVPPSAIALIDSLRGVGYSLETATADLIDNSISAAAKNIAIRWEWSDGSPVGWILDDGVGMTQDEAINALRFGSAGPSAQRNENDLGRFGLGLKTASLSQCRRLTVVSKTTSGMAIFAWDIDYIRSGLDKWELLEGDYTGPKSALDDLLLKKSGTLVVWEKVDFGRQEDLLEHETFLANLRRLEDHLEMIFHRFLNGDANRISISLNGNKIRAWDPFLESNEATLLSPEQTLKSPGGRIKVRGFVLPHRDRFKNADECDRAGGPEGWNAQQGFYIYRQKRLLHAGGWLGLGGSKSWTRDEPSKLARIRVDIPNSADFEWRIDIRKAIARPPDAVREPLKKIAAEIRRRAREVFVHRGVHGNRTAAQSVSRIWKINPDGVGRRYTIDRNHDVVRLVQKKLGANAPLLGAIFDLVERTVPVDKVWLDVTEKGGSDVSTDKHENKDLIETARALLRTMEKAGVSPDEAIPKIISMDPFDQVSNLAKYLASKH